MVDNNNDPTEFRVREVEKQIDEGIMHEPEFQINTYAEGHSEQYVGTGSSKDLQIIFSSIINKMQPDQSYRMHVRRLN